MRRTLRHRSIFAVAISLCLLLLCGCLGSASEREQAAVDSLNDACYALRYRSLADTEQLARQALSLAEQTGYSDGRFEALCWLGWVRGMRLDFAGADSCYREVAEHCNNVLLRMLADAGEMSVCVRQSRDRDYYSWREDYEQGAQRLSGVRLHGRRAWLKDVVESSFYLTESIYYYYMRRESDMYACFDAWADRFLQGEQPAGNVDAGEWAMYCFLRGNVRSAGGGLEMDNVNWLLHALDVSRRHYYGYVVGKVESSLGQGLSKIKNEEQSEGGMLAKTDSAQVNERRRLRALGDELLRVLGSTEDEGVDSLDLWLVNDALRCFRIYGSGFDESQAWLSASDYWLNHGDGAMALAAMDSAEAVGVKTLEWRADVAEHWCLVHSALGDKAASDAARNEYLDVLDSVRQDRRMEQRLGVLEDEQRSVERSLWGLLATVGVLAVAWLLLRRRLVRRSAEHYEEERHRVESEMAAWRAETDQLLGAQQGEAETLREEGEERRMKAEQWKRGWVDRCACVGIVNGIRPYLDRALRLCYKKAENLTAEDLDYVGELMDRIGTHNEVLMHWVDVRKGMVRLNVETFSLRELMDIVRKADRVFAQKGLTLSVADSEASVKADKALTLFMMNTLLDNARKYSGEGGTVRLWADESDDFVEVSVQDEGRGLSPEDVKKINTEHLTLNSLHDKSDAASAEPGKEGGWGFGLMNCRGIIEKYKKTSKQFAVCAMGVESELGKGSRFWFRLPKGLRRTLAIAALLLLGGQDMQAQEVRQMITDSVGLHSYVVPESPHLRAASDCADSTYFSNVDGRYADALAWADSACAHLNAYYREQNPGGTRLMHLMQRDSMPEISLWEDGFATDYFIILDIRNEAAIAALALNLWDVYYYNNEIYTRLYKLMAQDPTLEAYCNALNAANRNKRTALVCLVALLLAGILIYLVVYYRKTLLPIFNMRQILELSRRIYEREPQERLSDIIREGVNDIRATDGVVIQYANGAEERSQDCPEERFWNDRAQRYPLVVSDASSSSETNIGTVAFVFRSAEHRADDERQFGLIAKYLAENIYYSQVRMAGVKEDIEVLQDEKRRAELESNRVHVCNMVLDNCLSTIKHETIYYPSRIRQLVNQLQAEGADAAKVDDLRQVMTYYKEVYSLLSAQASRQLGVSVFRRKHVPSTLLQDHLRQEFELRQPRLSQTLTLTLPSEGEPAPELLGDETMLLYLIDNLLDAAVQTQADGTIAFSRKKSTESAAKKEDFATFVFSFTGLKLTDEQCHNLFYPESLKFDAQKGQLAGSQFLIAKQIVREHDEHVRRGCRIVATPMPGEGGTAVEFSLPIVTK